MSATSHAPVLREPTRVRPGWVIDTPVIGRVKVVEVEVTYTYGEDWRKSAVTIWALDRYDGEVVYHPDDTELLTVVHIGGPGTKLEDHLS